MNNEEAIQIRYDKLSESTCCLSCGGAREYGKVREGETCVDLGCGKGNDVLRIADTVGSKGRSVGIDISEAMIAKAKKSASKLGVDNAEFHLGKLEKLPLLNDTADLVISNCVLNHSSDKLKTWCEIFRILKPGGRFAVSDIFATAEVLEKYRNDPEAIAECWAGASTREVYLDTLAEAGFIGVEVHDQSAPYPKGEIEVCSFTLTGFKPASPGLCCCDS